MEARRISIEQLAIREDSCTSPYIRRLLQKNVEKHEKPNHKFKILILDDDIMMLKILKKIFSDKGYEVVLCSNPFEVIGIIKENKVDLAILDLILPQSNGYEVTELIRKTEPDLPIIILSGSTITESKIKALKVGADDYITKPFEEKELIARVERTLIRHRNFKSLTIEDGLTGAYTKTYLWKKLKEVKRNHSRNEKVFSIAFIDMDSFKTINDTYGHLVGDEALKCFACTLKSTLRFTDYVFRFGGDEFVILFPETSEEEAYNALERFRNSNSYNICIENNLKVVFPESFSAGVTEVKDVNDSIEDILERADKALYQAKAEGKGRTVIYHNCK